MRCVLDTDVVVAAMRSPRGASAALLLAALDSRIELAANVALVLEYESVCLRDEHLLASGLTAPAAQQFVDGVAALIHSVTSQGVAEERIWYGNPNLRFRVATVLQSSYVGDRRIQSSKFYSEIRIPRSKQ